MTLIYSFIGTLAAIVLVAVLVLKAASMIHHDQEMHHRSD